MNPMIPITFAAGVAATAAASFLWQQHAVNAQQEQLVQQALQQIDNPSLLAAANPGETPLDALPEPGVPLEPGNARPHIEVIEAPAPQPGAQLQVRRTERVTPNSKDPIWSVELVVNGQTLQRLDALVGRSWRQNADRHQAGNESPLPPGQYRIDRSGIAAPPFDNPELGSGFWVPVTPLFQTGRSALGFHQDPSWDKTRESGTSGCIGLESKEATAQLVAWIRHYNIHRLVVLS